jgi:glycosyltransferase involved in cell wall biosynthesis
MLPAFARNSLASLARTLSLRIVLRLYARGAVLLAPNEELAGLLRDRCRRPVHLMRRGVDTIMFSPEKRICHDDRFTIGYVGRLTPEKNVRFLADLESALLAAGEREFRFLIVGEGSERAWLESRLQQATFTGKLKGEPLAWRYAEMDAFVFPSTTDTFGNVVLEAQASGVPAIVSPEGGPKFIIRDGSTGFVASGIEGFRDAVRALKSQSGLRREMREAARALSLKASWQAVFEELVGAYRLACAPPANSPMAGPALETTSALQGIK